MLKKLFAAGSTLGLAALVIAYGAAAVGARGQGVARSEDGRTGEFRFVVHKLAGEPPRLGGEMTIAINGPRARAVQISLKRLNRLALVGEHRNVCEFGGAAVLRVRTPSGWEAHPGTIGARVADNRPGRPNPMPDTIRIVFRAERTNREFAFAGAVNRGDIDVFVRSE